MKKIRLIILMVISIQLSNCKNGKSFKWNFENKNKYIYSYFQTVNGENKMEKTTKPSKSKIIGTGHLNVRSKGNKRADLSLTDFVMNMIIYDKNGVAKDTMTQIINNKVIQNMNEKGNFDDENVNILFKMIFPLPSGSLKIGENEKLPLKIPFNANGSKLFAKGFNTITYLKDGELDGKKCAILKGNIDVSDMKVPEELEGEYKFNTKGTATYYFDYENNYYLGVDLDLTMDVLMDADMYTNNINKNIIKIRYSDTE